MNILGNFFGKDEISVKFRLELIKMTEEKFCNVKLSREDFLENIQKYQLRNFILNRIRDLCGIVFKPNFTEIPGKFQ